MTDPTEMEPVPSQTADTGPPTAPTDLDPPGLKESLKRAIKEFKTDRGSLISAGMAFYWFLAIFPALAAAVGILGLTSVGTDTIASIKDGIEFTLKGDAATTLKSLVDNANDPTKGGGSLLTTILGLALALWGASAGMVALQRGLDVAYDVEDERKMVSARSRAMLLIAFTVVLGGIASVLIIFGAPLGEAVQDHLPFGETAFNILWTIARWVMGLIALSILFATYYFYGPNRETPRWTWVSAGGIVATVVWLLASLAFSLYVSTDLGNLNEKYGTLIGVVSLLLWLYLTAIAIILGAELNAELERQAEIDRTENGGARGSGKKTKKTKKERKDRKDRKAKAEISSSSRPAPVAPARTEAPVPDDEPPPAPVGAAPASPSPAPERTGSTSNGSFQSQWLSYGRSTEDNR